MSEREVKKIWYKSYELEVPSSGYSNPLIEFDLPRDAKIITGIRVESDNVAVAYNRAFVGIEISNEEVVPAKTSIQMFMFNDSADEKFLNIGRFGNENAKMRVSFVDAGVYTYNPYKVRIMLKYEK